MDHPVWLRTHTHTHPQTHPHTHTHTYPRHWGSHGLRSSLGEYWVISLLSEDRQTPPISELAPSIQFLLMLVWGRAASVLAWLPQFCLSAGLAASVLAWLPQCWIGCLSAGLAASVLAWLPQCWIGCLSAASVLPQCWPGCLSASVQWNNGEEC